MIEAWPWISGLAKDNQITAHFVVFFLGLMLISGLAWLLSKAIEIRVGRSGARPRPAEAFVRLCLGMMFFAGGICALLLLVWLAGSP